MDTASADSYVTDSAAGSSAWGGGARVKNGSLNVNADKSVNKPILKKFKDVGKSVGCVTTVPATHATPAGFSVAIKSRSLQDEIASMYLQNHFDVMMGGGKEYFDGTKRKDKKNIFGDFKSEGFDVAQTRDEMLKLSGKRPVIGIYHKEGLPYTLDRNSDNELQKQVPTLAEMTEKAISIMKDNPQGFALQVEGGKVDWAAHANDTTALIHDQIAFDDAIKVAVDFAAGRDDTLVIITTDHGNANPGLIKSEKVNQKFETLFSAKHTNDWVLQSIQKTDSVQNVIERIHYAQGITVSKEEAKSILDHYNSLENDGLYNSYKLPFRKLAEIQTYYTSVGWAGMNHSSDLVELAMFGAESEWLPPVVLNTDLHNYMLKAAGVLQS